MNNSHYLVFGGFFLDLKLRHDSLCGIESAEALVGIARELVAKLPNLMGNKESVETRRHRDLLKRRLRSVFSRLV